MGFSSQDVVFSRKTVEATLTQARTQAAPLVIETDSDKGPGYVNPYKILTGEADIFLTTSPVSVKPPPKILISSPLLRERPLYPIEQSYFASLVEHYEVYFWRGPDSYVLKSGCMLLTLDDFMQKRSKIVSAKKEDVRQGLGTQGLAADDMIILDQDALLVAMQKLKVQIELDRQKSLNVDSNQEDNENNDKDAAEFKWSPPNLHFLEEQDPTQLDLTWDADVECLDEMSNHLNCDLIKTITISTLHTEEEAKKLISYFSQVETIIVLLPMDDFIQHCLPVFSGKNLVLWLTIGDLSNYKVVLPAATNIATLTLIASDRMSFSTEPGAQVRHLKVIQSENTLARITSRRKNQFYINLFHLPGLMHLEINVRNNQLRCTVRPAPQNNLTEFNANNFSQVFIVGPRNFFYSHPHPVKRFPHIKTLRQQRYASFQSEMKDSDIFWDDSDFHAKSIFFQENKTLKQYETELSYPVGKYIYKTRFLKDGTIIKRKAEAPPSKRTANHFLTLPSSEPCKEFSSDFPVEVELEVFDYRNMYNIIACES